MRYFAKLAYNGANYSGWQIQPNTPSVQETIEQAMSLILGTTINITGCGRTDTGVHASAYFIHFDFDGGFPQGFVNRINKYLPADIVIYHMMPVKPDAHARFDAYYRSYEYHISFDKDPFREKTNWHYPFIDKVDFKKLQQAANLILQYEEFAPFCKTNSDAKTMFCDLKASEWVILADERRMIYRVAANRFLRGMVRLLVGMCLYVATDKLTLEEVKTALDNQTPLPKSYSVPPNGLFLNEVRYGRLTED